MRDWSNIISAGVGPVIVISACGLLCLTFYNRLALVVARLRGFSRERLCHQEALAKELSSTATVDERALAHHRELIGMLEVQTRHVMNRARWIRRTLTCLLLSIAFLAACSLCLGLSGAFPALTYGAVAFFMVGLLLVIVAVLFALVEIQFALHPVELEVRFVQDVLD